MKRLLQLAFLPSSVDLALLVLRAWAGLSMVALHGWGKVGRFGPLSSTFADPFGIGPFPSLVLAAGFEVVGAVLLVLGLFTRLAALAGMVTMGVAFAYVHGTRLSGPGNGELAFVYLAIFTALFLAGPGRYSMDGASGAAPRGRR